MPIDVTANYIRIRVANPKQFIRFRMKRLGAGLMAVIGFKKGGGSQIQSFLFPKSSYTLSEARAWISKHGYSVSETYNENFAIFAVFDIDISKEGEEMFIERPLIIEETEKYKELSVEELFNKAIKSMG